MQGPEPLTLAKWRHSARLALFVVLVQLVASYGHLHPQDFRSFFHGVGAPTLRADHDPWPSSAPAADIDDACSICGSVQLLGSSALPDDFALPPLRVADAASPVAAAPLWLTPPRHLLFETRGPPPI